ncbi:MAG TPA: GNAT family N-acetyltransferase [Spirochaetia bacterium]|nr:GNAT family N-acetyltransferase [Spirochaetia bacterium]
MHIRAISESDADQFLLLTRKLDEETVFRLYEPGENLRSVEEERCWIREIISNPRSVLLVTEIDDCLVGYLMASGRDIARIKHVVHISIGILQSHTGKGIGTRLFAALEEWARTNDVHRLELTVMVNNPIAQALYSKMGFKIEGTKRDSLFVNGTYIDDIYMAKLIP